jgi:hypothetical protein
MSKKILFFILFSLFILINLEKVQAQEIDWKKTYLEDLESARAAIASNHPGMVDKQNPSFSQVMDTAYREAQTAAAAVKNYNSYRIALTRFANQFQDEHLSVSFKRPFEDLKEAGIYPVFQNGAFVVSEIDERYGDRAAQLRGATLISCEGRSSNQLFRQRVLSWRGRPSIKADWYKLAPLLLVDYGAEFSQAPNACQFRVRNRTIKLSLKWTAVAGQNIEEKLKKLVSFENRRLDVEEFDAGNALWVNLPTFAVNEKQEVDAMNGLLQSLKNKLTQNNKRRLLVFDLRGNTGGSTAWGEQIAGIVFGDEWLKRAKSWFNDGVYTEWRVSSDNVAALRGIVKQQEQRHGADSDNAKFFRSFADSMAEALQNKEPFIGGQTTGRNNVPPPPKPVTALERVVLLTSASCFSACLDFLDKMRLAPQTVQVGQTTGVDTVYMESWGKELPSKMGRINYPMKVYRNRRRGNNEAYPPRVQYDQQLHNTTALRDWILQNYRRWRFER